MENPLRRLRNQLGLTQQELADKTNLTRGTILRTEQGLMSSPPASLVGYLAREHHEEERKLRVLYYNWVNIKRNENLLGKRGTSIEVASVAALAKLLVVQISMVQEYLKDGRGNVIPSILDEFRILRVTVKHG